MTHGDGDGDGDEDTNDHLQERAWGDVGDAAAHKPASPEPSSPPCGQVLLGWGAHLRGPLCWGKVSFEDKDKYKDKDIGISEDLFAEARCVSTSHKMIKDCFAKDG